MKTRIIILSLLACSIMTLQSCKKKGCTDKNSDNYDPDAEKSDGSCVFRYATGVQVSTPTSVGYDPFDGPDLYVKFAKKTSSTWDYVTNTGADNYSSSLSVPSNIMFTNEDWECEIYDYDTADPDDLIMTGTFNPLKTLTLTGSGVSITFQYTTK